MKHILNLTPTKPAPKTTGVSIVARVIFELIEAIKSYIKKEIDADQFVKILSGLSFFCFEFLKKRYGQ
jgi:hypothetical protein